MTEAEWLAYTEAFRHLLNVRHYASVRKLRLVAAGFARWLQTLPPYEDARPCADLIEEVADKPQSWTEIESRIWLLPGSSWSLSHTLASDDVVGQEVSKMLFYATCDLRNHVGNADSAHRTMVELLHDVFGNPYHIVALNPSWLRWNDGVVQKLAEAIYRDHRFADLPILADALEDAGCTDAPLLAHCRGDDIHVRGCWVVDLLLCKW
jgi:hypothetical protein